MIMDKVIGKIKQTASKIKLLIAMLFIIMAFPVLGLQDILGSLGGILGGIGGRASSKSAPANVFKKVLSHADWWDTALESSSGVILCKAGVYTVIGRFKVSAQQTYHFGFGSPAYPDNQGYLYIALYDDTATNSVKENGSVRLVQRNATGTVQLVVAEFRTEQLAGDVADRNKQISLPEQVQFPLVGEDSYLEIHFKADAIDSLISVAIGTAAGLDIWNVPVSCYQ